MVFPVIGLARLAVDRIEVHGVAAHLVGTRELCG